MSGGCPRVAPAARATGTGEGRDGERVSIEIANESGVEIDEVALAALARHVLDEMRIHPLAELSVLLVDESVMTELHVRWMGESGPTDVLAFPMDELRPPQPGGTRAEHAPAADPPGVPGLLGDVVICPQVAGEQARNAEHEARDEIDLLCTHGILHLLGYDHADPDEHATMFGLQDRLLASWRSEREPASGQDGSGQNSSGSEGSSGQDGSGQDGGSEGSSPGSPRGGGVPGDLGQGHREGPG
jgi:probable rRNA maturation factor